MKKAKADFRNQSLFCVLSQIAHLVPALLSGKGKFDMLKTVTRREKQQKGVLYEETSMGNCHGRIAADGMPEHGK